MPLRAFFVHFVIRLLTCRYAMAIHDFSAGLAMLPVEVRERLAEALAPGADGSLSITEVSHCGQVGSVPRQVAICRMGGKVERCACWR